MTARRLPGVTTRYRSEHVQLVDYVCCGSQRGPASTEAVSGYEIAFVRRGAFALWTHKRERLVTPNELLFLTPGATYSASHPVAGGDECSIVACSPDLVAPLMGGGFTVRVVPATPAVFRRHLAAFHLTQRVSESPLEVEETLFDLIRESLVRVDGSIEAQLAAATPVQRRYVRRAQEVICSHFTESIPLATIAKLAGASPFHLSRLFRSFTGTSMHRYQTALRLRAAIDRILDGASDLAMLAHDLGFSSHSHFTSAFRKEFGVPPASLRGERRAAGVIPRHT